MPVYMCRWVNGDVSFVSAPSKEGAVALLDEVANAEGCPLFVVKDFMVHLRLKDEGKLELEEIGEETYHQIMEKAYPVLGSLPLHHRDPFDRLLISQAFVEGTPSITGDRAFAAYGVGLFW